MLEESIIECYVPHKKKSPVRKVQLTQIEYHFLDIKAPESKPKIISET